MEILRPFPNKDTTVCISIASRPSNFGCSLHNAGYSALKLNFIYKSFEVSDQKGLIDGIRAMGLRGCSVSMPFKETIISEIDKLDTTAKEIGAVNTIVNEDGILTGFNTDAFGAEMVLKDADIIPNKKVLILGAGGAARAILYALKKLNVKNITVCNRDEDRINEIDRENRYARIKWEERNGFIADLLINATSIGMNPDEDQMPVSDESIYNYNSIFDVVVTPPKTKLIISALNLGKQVIYGYQMSCYQAMKQFELYTRREAPQQAIQKAMFDYLGI